MILADTFEWSTFPDAIRFIGDNPGLLWDKSLQQLGLSVAALAIAVAIALPPWVTSTRDRSSRSPSPTSGARFRASS